MKPLFRIRILVLSSLVLGGPAFSSTSVLTLLNRFNLITGDYSAHNETEGSAFVSGNYLPQGSNSRFGFNGGAVASDTSNVLWLNNGIGSANSTVTLITGSLVSRVAVNHSQFNLNGNAPGTPAFNEGQVAWDSAMSTLGLNSAAEMNSTLLSASSQWSALAANSIGVLPGNGSYTFNATSASINGHQVAVFNVSAATLFGSGTFDRLEASFNGAETLLINVSGTGTINVNKNFTNGFQNNESKILFNFYQASDITVSSNFRGTIFAPNATVTQGGVNIDGSVVSAAFNQNAEVHDQHFASYLPFVSIPEPSSIFLTVLGAAACLRRRREG